MDILIRYQGKNKMSNKILFCSPRDKYGCFSNFSQHAVIVNGKYYETTEHLYQASKTTNEKDHEFVRTANSPKLAKTRAYTVACVPNWESLRIEVMENAILEKCFQHQIIWAALLSTGDAELIEFSRKDHFWGQDIHGIGENWLGKLWMQLRNKIRALELTKSLL